MHHRSIFIIFFIVFIDLIGFGIVIPILPYYAKNFQASAWELGWLMTSYSLTQFIFSPFWGRISDSIGRRPILLLSILGTGISMIVLGMAHSLQWLFIGRILAGFFGANLATAYAYITDVTTEKNRAKGLGIVGAAFGLGFIFGPALGGMLSRYGFGVPMFAAAILALLNLIFAFFKLEESPIAPEIRYVNRLKRFDFDQLRMALGAPQIRFATCIFFLITFAVTQMEVCFALFMKARYDFNADTAGILLALMGIIMVAVQGGLIGKLVHRYGETKLVIFGSLLCAVSLAFFAISPFLIFTVPMLMTLAFGHSLLHPSLSSIAASGGYGDRRGMTMGIFQSSGSLARVLGPPCAGWLFDHIGIRSPFYSGSFVLLVAFTCSLVWFQNQKQLSALREKFTG